MVSTDAVPAMPHLRPYVGSLQTTFEQLSQYVTNCMLFPMRTGAREERQDAAALSQATCRNGA